MPRYIGAVLDNVVVNHSKWLKNHLKSIGLEPINNVVDVTNFVMFEFGTPMHAFDRNAIQNDISIKNAIKGTEFETLDGEKRKLTGNELMITSGGKIYVWQVSLEFTFCVSNKRRVFFLNLQFSMPPHKKDR